MKRWKITILPCLPILALAILFVPDLGVAAAAARSTDGSRPTTTCGQWNVIPSPNAPKGGSALISVASISAHDVWAVGDSVRMVGGSQTYRTLTEHWNGTTWSIVPSPSPGPKFQIIDILFGVAATSTNDVWAVGEEDKANPTAYVEHWNGSQWSVISTPLVPNAISVTLTSVAVISANDVWAAGYYGDSAGTLFTLVEHWNGTQWRIVSSPNVGSHGSRLAGVAVISANDAWAVGTYGTSSTTFAALIEHWDGTRWKVVSNPNVSSPGLTAVTAIATNDVWSVGSYSPNNNANTLAEHWNGTKWSMVSSPNAPKSSFNKLNAVAAVASKNVWSVGEDTLNSALTEHWNGTQWKLVSSPMVGAVANLNGVTVVPGTRQLWAVGGFYQTFRSLSATLIEFYC